MSIHLHLSIYLWYMFFGWHLLWDRFYVHGNHGNDGNSIHMHLAALLWTPQHATPEPEHAHSQCSQVQLATHFLLSGLMWVAVRSPIPRSSLANVIISKANLNLTDLGGCSGWAHHIPPLPPLFSRAFTENWSETSPLLGRWRSRGGPDRPGDVNLQGIVGQLAQNPLAVAIPRGSLLGPVNISKSI